MDLPAPPQLAAQLQRYASLLASRSGEWGQPRLVLPTSEFFPDAFRPTSEHLDQLVRRLQGHAGIEDIPVRAELVGEAASCGTSSCGSGGCAPSSCGTDSKGEQGELSLRATRTGWELGVPVQLVADPIVLTATLSRILGQLFLMETAPKGQVGAPPAPAAELAAVGLGYGALLLEGSHLYRKSCGGPSVSRATALQVTELAFPVALFLAQRDLRPTALLRHLSTTQKAVFREAWEVTSSNMELVRQLRTDPELLAAVPPVLRPASSGLQRLLSRAFAPKAEATEESLEAWAKNKREKGASKGVDAELKALVQDAFD